MQVKKFEARSMKEALEMIKRELGPEAIILSAKDNSQRFGLVGEGSVEVTAAISESSLQKKKFIENKLPENLKENFYKAPASQQKEWVQKFVDNYRKDVNQKNKSVTDLSKKKIDTPYIQIEDEVNNVEKSEIKLEKKNPSTVMASNENLTELKKEVEDLKNLIRQLKTQPQPSIKNQFDYLNIPIELGGLYDKLRTSGLSEEFALNLLDESKKYLPSIKHKNRSFVEGWIANHIMDNVKIQEPHSKVQVFLGPSGSGKTSLIVKWASELIVNRRKKVALVTTEQTRVGAMAQLRTYSQILNMPFAVIKNRTDWSTLVAELNDYDYILCDTQGTSLKGDEEKLNLRTLLPPSQVEYKSILVLPANNSLSELQEIMLNYRSIQINLLSLTRLDDCHKKGYIFELSQRFRVPLFSWSMGSKIPDDFELATKERLVDFVLSLSAQGGIDAIR